MRRVKLLLAVPKKDSAAACVTLWVLIHETLVDRLLLTVFFSLLLARLRPIVFLVTCPFGNLVGFQSPFSPGFRSSFTLLILANVWTASRKVAYWHSSPRRAYWIVLAMKPYAVTSCRTAALSPLSDCHRVCFQTMQERT